jgi:hypothetical protein
MLRTTAIALMLTATFAAVEADPGLLFHASFDDTLDAWSLGGNGTPDHTLGPEPEFAPGRFGSALLCGHTLPIVHYPTEGNVLPESGTVSLWVCPQNWDGTDANFHSFFESGGQDSGTGWLVLYKYYQNSWLLLRYAVGNSQVGMAKASAADWQPGEWHHLAATWSRDAMRIYVDGELAAEAPEPHVFPELAETFKLGDDGWHLPHEGARTLLDEVRIYAYPLDAERIGELAGRWRLSVARAPEQGRWLAKVQLGAREVTGARLQIVPRDGGEALVSTDATIGDGVAVAELDVADLPPGEYTVTAQILGEGNAVIGDATTPMRRLEQQTLVLESQHIRVSFDGGTGAISKIEAPALGWTAALPAVPTPLLELGSVSFSEHARFYRPSDVTALRADESSVRSITIEAVEGGQRLTAQYEWDPGVIATITADLPDDSPVLSLQASVQCPRPLWPSTAVRVPTANFPQLAGLRIGDDSTDDTLATGYIQGETLADPAESLPRDRVAAYPGRACVPWQDLYDAAGGLALIPQADGSCQLELLTGRDEGLLHMTNRWYSLLEPGEVWRSPIIELTVHAGAWHGTADRFREWSLANTPPRVQPDWLATCDGWTGSGGESYTFPQLPEMLAKGKEYGLSYLQLWAQMIGGGVYYCFFYPNPKMGTPEELRRALQEVEDAGGHAGFYSNAICFDGAIDQNPWIDQIVEEYGVTDMPERPKFYEEASKAIFVGPGGEMKPATAAGHSLAGYLDGYWPMDPNAKWWQDYLADWIKTWGDDYGADVWYLDSFPVPGYGLGPASYALHLDHPRGLSEGQIALLKRIREGFDGPILYEGVACAAFMPWTNWCLGTEFSFGSGTWSRPEIFVYSFGDVYPVFSGTCNRWTGIGRIFPDIEEPRQEDTMNMVFLLGERFDALNLWQVPQDAPYGAHMKKLIALRAKVRDVVYAGRMMDVRGLSGMPEGVEARVFVGQDQPGAVATVWDRRAEREAWELRIDPSALPWPEGLTSATVLSLDGSEQPVGLAQGGGVITMLVDAAEVCAIRFE